MMNNIDILNNMMSPKYTKGDTIKIDFTNIKPFIKEAKYAKMVSDDLVNDQRIGIILDIEEKTMFGMSFGMSIEIDKIYSYKVLIGQTIQKYNERHLRKI